MQHAFDKKHTHFYKTYDAIVEGKLPAVPLTINWPIGRKPGSIIERYCTNEGKPARTDITVISHTTNSGDNTIIDSPSLSSSNPITGSKAMVDKKFEQHFTYVQCLLHTGRTHQIRVHMGYIGHPLPADYLYNPVYDTFKRQPLHSLQLEFRHPITGQEMCLMAPVPEDISKVF